jgi:signal transduction histidine kinase
MNNIKVDALTSEIFDRLHWFIRLRWLAILGTFLGAAFLQWILLLPIFSETLLYILCAMLFCNIIYRQIFKTKQKTTFVLGKIIITPSDFANLQIGLDLIFLTFLWQMYGGIENPIMFFYIFHMLIASILLSKYNSYLWAVFSSLLITATALMELFGILDHHSILGKISGIEIWDNLYWNIFILTSFCFTLFMVVYITSSISKRLRQKNQENIALQKQISDRKLEAFEKKLYFSEKMAALGKLAAGMAHEINNPLTTVLTYSECLLDEVEKDSDVEKDLKTIIEETIRIREIVKKVLNFARSSVQTEMHSVEINKELKETVNMIANQMQFINIKFLFDLEKDIPKVRISREHLKQITINLFVNASQAMKGSGKIYISTSTDTSTGNSVIKVKDTGPGISLENKNKIFDPFFTTKKQGEGTGLGLSVSYGLIKMYGGTIQVESDEESGATFIICLPQIK